LSPKFQRTFPRAKQDRRLPSDLIRDSADVGAYLPASLRLTPLPAQGFLVGNAA
jgi:hypothetical protein